MKANPICEKCKRYCSSAGSSNVIKGTNKWKCFGCGYEVTDIDCIDSETNEVHERIKVDNNLTKDFYFQGKECVLSYYNLP